MTHLYSKSIDYCPDDSMKVIPKYQRDYIPCDEKPVVTGYKCNLCEYETNNEKGMQIHIGRSHKKGKE